LRRRLGADPSIKKSSILFPLFEIIEYRIGEEAHLRSQPLRKSTGRGQGICQ
jgi:hypothetical protein